MKYLVQKNVFKEENYNKIFQSLDRLGLEYEIIDCLPFVDELEYKTDRKDIFTFGSVKMARLATKNDWNPGSFYGGNHDFKIYKEYYNENLLNHDSIICDLTSEIDFQSYSIPHGHFRDIGKFIRPTNDNKLFTGKVFTETKWLDLLNNTILPYVSQRNISFNDSDTKIQVSIPKKIYKEARVWIVNGKVITSSYYFFNGNVAYSEDVDQEGLDFAQSMVDIYQVAPAFVMDICLTPDGWKIVEINCINCSGFYKADLQKVLIALEDLYNPI